MKKIIYSILITLFFQFTIFSQEGWILQNSGTDNDLWAVYFFNQDNACTVGDEGSVLISTNGGINWNDHSIMTDKSLRDVFFINQNIGWIVGEDITYPYSSYRGLYGQSFDGGINWMFQDDYWMPRSVFFVNENVGWLAEGTNEVYPYYNGLAKKSIDGGNTWSTKLTGTDPSSFLDVYFINENLGWVVGFYGEIFKTTDGGGTWLDNSVGNETWRKITFLNNNFGWVLGVHKFLFSTNQGNSWTTRDFPSNIGLRSAYFINENIGWSVTGNIGIGEIWVTTDGGINWSNQFNSSQYLNSVYFVDQNTGWVVGGNGTILKTTNGGVTFVDDGIETPKEFSLHQNYPNPFNPTTTITYQIPERGFVTLKVYDALGEEVSTLINEEKLAGRYEVQFTSHSVEVRNLTSGIYFYQLKADEYSKTKKMILLR